MYQKALGFLAKSGGRINRFILPPLLPAAAAGVRPPAAAEPGRGRPRGRRRGEAGIHCYHEWEQYFARWARSMPGAPQRAAGPAQAGATGEAEMTGFPKNKDP